MSDTLEHSFKIVWCVQYSQKGIWSNNTVKKYFSSSTDAESFAKEIGDCSDYVDFIKPKAQREMVLVVGDEVYPLGKSIVLF